MVYTPGGQGSPHSLEVCPDRPLGKHKAFPLALPLGSYREIKAAAEKVVFEQICGLWK